MSQASAPEKRPTVLVVDDEEDLRDIMRRMLERRGFTTLVAGDSKQAIAVCREHPGDIDILVTDLGLPGVSGRRAVPRPPPSCGPACGSSTSPACPRTSRSPTA